jgi:hypothetical protein
MWAGVFAPAPVFGAGKGKVGSGAGEYRVSGDLFALCSLKIFLATWIYEAKPGAKSKFRD